MFRNMKVGLRLGLGFGLTIAFMIAIVAVSLHQSRVSHEKLQRIVKINNVRVQLSNDMIEDAREMAVTVRGILLAKYNNESDKRIQERTGNCAELMRTYAGDVAAIKKLIPEDDTKGYDMLREIEDSGTASRILEEQAIELAVSGKLAEASSLITVKAYPSVKQWISQIDNFIRHNEELTALRYIQAEEAARTARTIMLVLGTAAIVLSALIVILLSLGITRPLNLTVNAANRIASGDMEVDLSAAGKRGDELGVLAQTFGKMVATLRNVSVQADEISKGNYSMEVVPRSNKDTLSFSLQRMTVALKDNRDAVQRQDWLKTGIAQLNQVVSGDPDMSTLTSKVISEISTYLNAHTVAIYLTGDGDGATLSLAGSYAYKKRQDLSNVFKMGEGLVGQAALEKRQILVGILPEDYIRISSGLGEWVPRFVCVTPFINEGRVKGVVEVGSLEEMTDRQMEYLNKAMPVLALAVESAETRTKLAKSLKESQSLAEELQVQQEELRTSNEELEEQTKALEESEEEIHLLLDSTAEAIYGLNMNGNCTFCNKACLRLLGYTHPGELLGKNMHWQIHSKHSDGSHFPLEDCRIFQAFKNGERIHVDDEMFWHADGTSFPAEYWSFPQRKDGVIVGAVVTFLDITERKRMEAEKAKLEEQNRQLQKAESLGLMSGSIAHIFNNQLQIVQGYLEMVLGDLPSNDSNALKLTIAMQAVNKASGVSSNLLSYLGQKQVKLELLDLAELCRMRLPVLQGEKPENVTLKTDLPSPGPCISADVKQIKQILTNLVINAWESIGDGSGTIHLSVRTVSSADIPKSHRFPIEWRSRKQLYACLEVKDSGCGIREEDMDKVFDPFFSTKFTGRGLGLSVARFSHEKRARAQIPSIPSCKSLVIKGCVFKIDLLCLLFIVYFQFFS